METAMLPLDDLIQKYPKIGALFVKAKEGFPVHLHEHHGHLLQELDAAWGTAEFITLIDDLVFSDRPDRQGFSNEVMMELFALKSHHDKLFPQFVTNQFDPFASVSTDEIDELFLKHGTARIEKVAAPQVAKSARPAATAPIPPAVPSARANSRPLQLAETAPSALPTGKVRPLGAWPEIASLEELRELQKRRAAGERLPVRDRRKIVEILKQYADITDADLAKAIDAQNSGCDGKKREPIGKVLLKLGLVDEEAVIRALCLQYGVIMVNLQRFHIDAEAMRTIAPEVAKNLRAIPIAVLDGTLFLAVENPFSFEQREYFVFLTKRKVELVMASGAQISQKLLDYGQVRSVQQGKEEFRTLAQKALGSSDIEYANAEAESENESALTQDDASIVGIVNKIISDAVEVGASDIHIESFYGDGLAYIRFRRDGRLEEYSQYPASYHRAVVSRIKIMANLDISERRIAQDGKISFLRAGRERMDLRVATVPTSRGIENVAIRLLHAGDPYPLEALKMSERDLTLFRRLIHRPYGLILVCGPTGSGKTTTLHSVLRELNTPDKKIWTAEDPIEIVQKRICQVQVNAKIGWTFAAALRSFLRADPDIIMIGEMRDQETAKIALEASMTGHLVLSTLHTNSASETTARLIDLEVDPFNLGDALIMILAQRLTRCLCSHCAEKVLLSPTEIDDLTSEYYYSAHKRMPSLAERELIVHNWKKHLTHGADLALWKAQGCEQCGMTGYKGRMALFELLEATPEIRELVIHRAPASEYQRIAVAQGMRTLKQDGIEKALRGWTDMAEVRGACN
jgi:type II secretory ATPase GspE/PulE/Tfp pilus assembly ATPase PilB-like protein